MTHPRVFVDYQNADVKGRIRRICNGTLRDLERQQIQLTDGMVLTLYEDERTSPAGRSR